MSRLSSSAGRMARRAWRVPAGGGSAHQVLTPQPTFTHGVPMAVGDGETVLFVDWGPGFTEDDFLALGSTRTNRYVRTPVIAVQPLGVIGDRIVYTTPTGAVMTVRFDRRSLALTGDPVRVMEGVSPEQAGAALSASGTLVYLRGLAMERL